MKSGMMWLDTDPKTTLAAKVEKAAEYYEHKYGQRPNLCFVHPGALATGGEQVGNVAVKPLKGILKHHFWLGVDQRE